MLRKKVPGSPGQGNVALYKGRTRFLLEMTPVSEKVAHLVTVLAWNAGSPVFTPWHCITQGLAPTCVILATGRRQQEDQKFKITVSYTGSLSLGTQDPAPEGFFS